MTATATATDNEFSYQYREGDDIDNWMKYFSYKVLRRMHSAGAKSVSFEDVYSECKLALFTSMRRYNSNLNVPFKPYAFTGIKMYVNKWVEKQISYDINASYKLDQAISDDMDGTTLGDIIEDENEESHENFNKDEIINKIYNDLSFKARVYYKLVLDTPRSVVDEFRKVQERIRHSNDIGYKKPIPKTISDSFYYDVMNITPVEGDLIKREIEEVARKYV